MGNENIEDSVKNRIIKELDTRLSNYETNYPQMESDLNAYKRLGTPEEISALVGRFTEMKDRLAQYEQLGSVDDVKDLMDAYESTNETLVDLKNRFEKEAPELDEADDLMVDTELLTQADNIEKSSKNSFESDCEETDDDIKDKKTREEGCMQNRRRYESEDLLAEYQELGTPEEIRELIRQFKETKNSEGELKEKQESYEALGTPEEIKNLIDEFQKSKDVQKEYEELGTPEEIKELAERFDDIQKAAAVNDISKDLGVDPEVVEDTLEKTESVADTKKLLRGVMESLNLKSFKTDRFESAQVVRSQRSADPRMDKLRKIINHNI